jgi:hypothetical protein
MGEFIENRHNKCENVIDIYIFEWTASLLVLQNE